MRKGIITFTVCVLLINILAPFASSQDTESTSLPRGGRRLIKEKVKDKITDKAKERKENLIDKIKDKIGRSLRFGARITGSLTAISENTLTVQTSDGASYSIDVTNAQCRRRFGGKCEWSELAVGDKVNVVGKWTDENKTAITAKLVRDASIQKRHGVLFGKVTAKSDSSFTMEAKRGGEIFSVTVYITDAKFINRKEETISYGDIQVSHRVRAKGVWDRTLKEMRETTEVKDFDLPTKASIGVTPTATQ